MPRQKKLLTTLVALLIAAVLGVLLAPLVVASGLRLWLRWAAPRENLLVEVESIDAPFLRPVVLHRLHLTSRPGAPFAVKIDAARVELDLNLAALFYPTRGRKIRSLTADAIGIDIRHATDLSASSPPLGLRLLQDLLASEFTLSRARLHLEDGNTIVDLRDANLSAAEVEAGVFTAGEFAINSPWLRKTFLQLRGATSWQEDRLTVGALVLLRGLDLDAFTIDLSHIGERSFGLELNLDAFGGKLRASVSSEVRASKRMWDVVGSASEVSLAQMSDALEFSDRASGSVHAGKITFRGEAANLDEAAATIWAEVTGLTWRDRAADTIMIGASLYHREIQVEQIYVKQRSNQLTLSGESSLPHDSLGWLNRDFRGSISASIADLGELARLFGANASDFAGQLAVEGSVRARQKVLEGQLAISGDALILFRAPVESLRANLALRESQIVLEQLELHRQQDFLHAGATVDLSPEHRYTFTLRSSLANVADYAAALPESFGGHVEIDWHGEGAVAAHSGNFHLRGHDLRLARYGFVLPFGAEFDGEYSPARIFFRQFHLSDQHADFRAFVTIAQNYCQLQSVRLDLNGQPKLQGNVYLPVALWPMHAWSDDPILDVDLALEPIDLAELTRALMTQPAMSGKAAGRLALYGPRAALEGETDLHLRDFVFDRAPRVSADVQARDRGGVLDLNAGMTAQGSDPVTLVGRIPLRLEKQGATYVLRADGPVDAVANFPAIFLGKLPAYFPRGNFVDGILSGKLAISESVKHPRVQGEMQLVHGQLARGLSLSAAMTFSGLTASIDFIRLGQSAADFSARGEIDFSDSAAITLKISVPNSIVAAPLLEAGDCVSDVDFKAAAAPGFPVGEVDLRGELFAPPWTILLHGNGQAPAQTFPFCRDAGKTLTFSPAPSAFP